MAEPGSSLGNPMPISLNGSWSGSSEYGGVYFSFSGLDPDRTYYFLVTADQEVDANMFDSDKRQRGFASREHEIPEIAFVRIKNYSDGYLGALTREWGVTTNLTVTLKEGSPTDSIKMDLDEYLVAVGQTHSVLIWGDSNSTEMISGADLFVESENESIVAVPGTILIEGRSPGTTKITIRSKLTGIFQTKTIRVVSMPSFEGSGTDDDPYIIRTAQDLYNIRFNRNATYKQVADISLGGYENWLVIGDAGNFNGFSGKYYGQGFKISNLTMSDARNYGDRNHSIFGYASYATFDGIRIENVNIATKEPTESGENMGALVGHMYNSTVTNCHAKNISIDGYLRVGGLIGLMDGSNISVSFSSAENVNLYAYLTGAGGLIGSGAGRIRDSYATGSIGITYGSAMGGLIGQFYFGYSWAVDVYNCYSACSMSGGGDSVQIGGIAPSNDSRDVRLFNCYYAEGITNDQIGSGIPLSPSEMVQSDNFLDWDFFTIWDIVEGNSYPFIHLREKAFKCKAAPLPLLYGKMMRA